MKKIITFLVVLVSTLSVIAADFKSGGLGYTIASSSTVEVAEYSDHQLLTDVVIPETVASGGSEYSVTSIGYRAFYECSSLTSVDIPNSVTSIGEDVFSTYPSLTSYIL